MAYHTQHSPEANRAGRNVQVGSKQKASSYHEERVGQYDAGKLVL